LDITVSKEDVERLAGKLEKPVDDFRREYLKDADEGPCFKNKPCSFLVDGKCRHYTDRPSVCPSFPHLDKKGFLGRTIGMIANASICPIVFNVWEALKARFDESDIPLWSGVCR